MPVSTARHIFIPDPQVHPGVPLDHLRAAGNAILEYRPDTVVHIGDHWDMPSLNSYEKSGSKYFHDKSYKADVESGLEGMEKLLGPLAEYNARRVRNRKKPYLPRLVFTMGNHEFRINRAVHEDPVLEGAIGLHDLQLEKMGFEVYPYQRIVEIDGIWYCLHPDHEVMLSDMTYKRLGDVEEGEELCGFEEHVSDGNSRKYAKSLVEKVTHDEAYLYEVKCTDGAVFHCTGDHLWLVKTIGTGYIWKTTKELRPDIDRPMKVNTVTHPDTSYEAGYLGGVFDGEGHVYQYKNAGKQGGLTVRFTQKDNELLEKARRCLDKLDVQYSVHKCERDGLCNIIILGSTADKISFLIKVGAQRLLNKIEPESLGRLRKPFNSEEVFIESVEDYGVDEIVRIQTSTSTMIVDGFAHHNCHNFVNQDSLKKSVIGGTIENKLQKIGNSFTMGHQQTFQYGSRHNAIGQTHMGLVWGTFYMHDEEYLGEQGNNAVHGIMVKNEVKDGFYCPMMLSMDYLLEEFL